MNDCPERNSFTINFWNYYKILEEDCAKMQRYICFRKENLNTCSDEIIKQIIATCAEFDNLCKEIAGMRDKRPSIHDYRKWFFSDEDYKNIQEATIILKKKNISLRPFDRWEVRKTMPWWDAYNNIKHNRKESYLDGNLGNLLSALAALYYLECMRYKTIAASNMSEVLKIFDVPPDVSDLFYIKDFRTRFCPVGQELITEL